MRFLKISLLLGMCLISSPAFCGSGTGFYVSHDGYLTTNFHVIEGGKSFAVYDRMGQFKAARVVQVDNNNDLAILKVEGDGFTFLPVMGSDNVKKGEKVFTIGFPNPELQGLEAKVTEGIISSLSGIQGQPSRFQITVPVQPGNSGGPLIDERGNVVGVIVAKLGARAALQTSGMLPENVNYAIKSNYLLELMATVPAIKRPQVATQGKLTLPELSAKAESAVVLVAVFTDVFVADPPPKNPQKTPLPMTKPQPVPPLSSEAPGSTANWVAVGVDSQENIWQIDVGSISSVSPVEFWVNIEYKKPQYISANPRTRSGLRPPAESRLNPVGVRYVFAKNKLSINCSSKTLLKVYYVYYNSDKAVVASGNSYSSEPIIPGSIGEVLFSFVCKGK
ncbi:MAG: serine protease [Proteobacteria bacterium]|nr:serine protease [Pseudomonadota bacterium]MCL2306929.1 serine protease [Pseudomonadota bacterium]